MASSSSSNNCFAALSSLNMPLGKFVLECISSGDKNAATGSNVILVAPGNNKYTAALKSKKLPPNVQATSASHLPPGRHLNFCLRQNLMFRPPKGLLPSKGLPCCCSLKWLKLVLPTGRTNSLNLSCANSFGPPRTIK